MSRPTTKADNIRCGCCDRRILSSQDKVDVYNTRYKRFEYYHASYLGCYESTRDNGKRRPMRNRFKPWLNIGMINAYDDDPVEVIPQDI